MISKVNRDDEYKYGKLYKNIENNLIPDLDLQKFYNLDESA